MYTFLENHELALVYANTAVTLNPDRWSAKEARAYANYNLSDYEAVISDLEFVVASKYYAGEEWFLLGSAHYYLHEYEQAAEAFEKSYEMGCSGESIDELYEDTKAKIEYYQQIS